MYRLRLRDIFCLPPRMIRMIFWKATLKSFGWKSQIHNVLKIDGSKNISIGNSVVIEYNTWLASIPLTGGGEMPFDYRGWL